MKKILVILIILLLCGCSSEEKEKTKILSTGELICIYKEQRVNEDTIYTSYYSFDFSSQGILKGAFNNEEIIFLDTKEEVKNKYKAALEETVKEYEGIEGIIVTEKIEDKIVSFNINMNVSKMDEEIKKDYYLDLDRISIYKKFTNMGYTCE